MYVKYLFLQYRLMVFIFLIFITNCSYQLQTDIADKKLKKYQKIPHIMLYSYDPFGDITRAIRTELYINKINFLDNLYDNVEIQNEYIYLYIVDTSESHVTTTVFPDGTEAGYQLVLHIYTKLSISHEICYPVNIHVYRAFIRDPVNILSNDIQEQDMRKLMYQEAAEKIVFNVILQYKKYFFNISQ